VRTLSSRSRTHGPRGATGKGLAKESKVLAHAMTTNNPFGALQEEEAMRTGGGKPCTDEDLRAAVLAVKAAHPDYGLARLRTHIKDAHGWELSEKRVKKVLEGDGRINVASAPPQKVSSKEESRKRQPIPTQSQHIESLSRQ
jgi:hypothetical protein